MSNQDKINEFLSNQTKSIKETIGFSFKLSPARPQSTDEHGIPYLTYSYGIVIDPVSDSVWGCAKKLSDKVMEKLEEIKDDKPTLNGDEYIKIAFREYPTFRIDGNRLRVTFRCLPYVFKLPDVGV